MDDLMLDSVEKETPPKRRLNGILFGTAFIMYGLNVILYELIISKSMPVFEDEPAWFVLLVGAGVWSVIAATVFAIIPYKKWKYGRKWTSLTLVMGNIIQGVYLFLFLLNVLLGNA